MEMKSVFTGQRTKVISTGMPGQISSILKRAICLRRQIVSLLTQASHRQRPVIGMLTQASRRQRPVIIMQQQAGHRRSWVICVLGLIYSIGGLSATYPPPPLPNAAQVLPAPSDSSPPLTLPPEALPPGEAYEQGKPHPLMHGDGFDHSLDYNYALTPHIILHPNLQQTTKPGAVDDDPQRFVGGLGAKIPF